MWFPQEAEINGLGEQQRGFVCTWISIPAKKKKRRRLVGRGKSLKVTPLEKSGKEETVP